MTTQMIIRLDTGLKERVAMLAKQEGKSLSELVRDLLEKYAREQDIHSHIDNLWERIGHNLQQNNASRSDINKVIRQVRSDHA